jgi:hypothetical protein
MIKLIRQFMDSFKRKIHAFKYMWMNTAHFASHQSSIKSLG